MKAINFKNFDLMANAVGEIEADVPPVYYIDREHNALLSDEDGIFSLVEILHDHGVFLFEVA